jgi:uncharacterized protein YndB with AHSA1/START domain
VTTVSITHDTVLPYSPAQVWSMLTDSAKIERWLMPNDFEPRLGHRFTFRTTPIPAANFDGIIRCEVVELEEPRRLAYTWTGGGLTTRVTYRLEPEGDGTRLSFEHSGFDLDNPVDQMAYHGMGSGWKDCWARSFRLRMDELVGAGQR